MFTEEVVRGGHTWASSLLVILSVDCEGGGVDRQGLMGQSSWQGWSRRDGATSLFRPLTLSNGLHRDASTRPTRSLLLGPSQSAEQWQTFLCFAEFVSRVVDLRSITGCYMPPCVTQPSLSAAAMWYGPVGPSAVRQGASMTSGSPLLCVLHSKDLPQHKQCGLFTVLRQILATQVSLCRCKSWCICLLSFTCATTSSEMTRIQTCAWKWCGIWCITNLPAFRFAKSMETIAQE